MGNESSSSPSPSPSSSASPRATMSSGPSPETASSPSHATNHAPTPTATIEVPLTLIDADDHDNYRIALNPEALHELTDSIRAHGLLHPLCVRRRGPRLQLVAGFRRLAACHLIGLAHVPVHILPADVHDDAAVRLAENVVRHNLSPVEEALAIERSQQETPRSPQDLAASLHRSVSWIRHRLALTNYDPAILEALHAGHLTLAVADELALVQDPTQRSSLLDAAIRNGCSASTARLWRTHANAYIGDTTSQATQPSPPPQAGPPPRVLKACIFCEREHDITTMSHITLCSPCLQQLQRAQDQTADPTPHQ